MVRFTTLFLTLLALIASATLANAAIDGPVTLESGIVQGVPGKAPGSEMFKGIPYAAPPVGDLRWRPPVAPAAWHGIRRADKFAPDCITLGPAGESTAPGTSEDCLYLNVWTPAKTSNEKLAVMVWVYGGAFVSGSASYPRFDGAGLNRKGVILVDMSYRAGLMGFLAHPLLTAESPQHASGNYGLLDTLAALQWVKANIAKFGGDPNRVTLFGQSSGSQIVNLLTVSPLAKGLFQRAIGESGAGFGEREPKPLAAAEQSGAAFTAPFAQTLAGLRAKSPQELTASAQRGDFEPVVDGWVVPQDPHAMLAAGRQNDVPTLVGSTADESQLSPRVTLASYTAYVHTTFGAHADAVLQRYPATTDAEARLATKTFDKIVLGDYNVGSWAAGELKTGKSDVFQYRFTHAPPPYVPPGFPAGATSPVGAPHGAEILYAFNNLDTQDRAWTADDRRVADIVSSYWTNFAKTGDPNGAGLPHWPSLRTEPASILELGDAVRVIAKPNIATMAFLDDAFYGADGIFTRPYTVSSASK